MNVQDLFDRASQIRDEREVGANSAERVGGLMFDMLNYSVENRRALNGDKDYVDANSYPYMAVYIESSDDWKELNDRLSDIDTIATTKFNGNIRFYLSGVRVDVQIRTLHYANKYTSQVAVGPLQVIGGTLAQATTADKIFRRFYNGCWSAWEEVACVGRAGAAIGAEVFNSYTGDAANEATGIYAHAEGYKTKAQGVSSHAEGDSNTALGAMSHAEGVANFVSSRGGHVEGSDNRINSADGATGRDSGYAHAEGFHNEIGPYAPQAHVEGSTNFAGSKNAHVEGFQNRLENGSRNSHAEGENNNIKAGAHVSHAEGGDNTNNGAAYAHVEGKSNVANNGATGGHVEGLNNIINNEGETACGYWNHSMEGQTLYSVGIGSSSTRKNAYELHKNGDAFLYGINGYDGTNASGGNSIGSYLRNQAALLSTVNEQLSTLKEIVSGLQVQAGAVNLVDMWSYKNAFISSSDLDVESSSTFPNFESAKTQNCIAYLKEGDSDISYVICPISFQFLFESKHYMYMTFLGTRKKYRFCFEMDGSGLEGYSKAVKFIYSKSSITDI